MSSYTPGPWIYYADLPSTDPNWHIVTTANKMRVLANVHIEPNNAMDEANARLIAAAPDMFEAIKAFLPSRISSGNRSIPDDIVIPLDVTMGELRRLEAAIAKAEGRAP